jgi:hypothetical protein
MLHCSLRLLAAAVQCSLGVDTDLLRGEALKRLKGDAEEAAPKRKKSVRYSSCCAVAGYNSKCW